MGEDQRQGTIAEDECSDHEETTTKQRPRTMMTTATTAITIADDSKRRQQLSRLYPTSPCTPYYPFILYFYFIEFICSGWTDHILLDCLEKGPIDIVLSNLNLVIVIVQVRSSAPGYKTSRNFRSAIAVLRGLYWWLFVLAFFLPTITTVSQRFPGSFIVSGSIVLVNWAVLIVFGCSGHFKKT